jgi:hypothetical protein
VESLVRSQGRKLRGCVGVPVKRDEELKTAADAVYHQFLAIERQLPIEDRIERTDSRYYADRREQVKYFDDKTARER